MRLVGPRFQRFVLFPSTVLATALAGAFAVAGLPPLSFPVAPGGTPALTEDDVVRMQAAVARLNEGRSIGLVERWRSEESHDAGEIILVRKFTARGMPCHTIRYVIRYQSQPASPRRLQLNWCQVAAKGWKIVELEG
jgi:hypothetical protein